MRRTLIAALSAYALVPAVAQAADPVYVRDPLTSKLHQRPKQVNFSDADLTGLKWIHWGKAKAIGRGRASVLVCEPSCADGHRERGTVRVVLSKRTTDGDRRVYACIRATVKGVPKAYSKISWMC
jgi:hypothetical protein